LKAEEGETVKVGQVVCLIDTSAARPEGSAAPAPAKEEAPKVEAAKPAEKKETVAPNPMPVAESKDSYAKGTPSPAAAKMISRKRCRYQAHCGFRKRRTHHKR